MLFSNAGVKVNPHPETRWELVGKRKGFEGNRTPIEGVGDWVILRLGAWVGVSRKPAVAKSAVVNLKDQLVCFSLKDPREVSAFVI